MKPKSMFLRQLLLYGIIGGCSASLDILLFNFLYTYTGLNEFIANILSTHCGIALSFSLNSRFNFKKTDNLPFRALSFYLTGLFGLALSEGLLWFGGLLKIDIMLVKISTVFMVAAIQFLLNKFIAFRK